MDYFSCTQTVGYRAIRPDLRASFPELLSLILEASLLHTESTPFGMEWYRDNNLGFLLTNWQAKVISYPKWNDEITIKTWPIMFKSMLAERTFEVYNSQGEVIVYVNSKWILMDLVNRRPTRLTKEVADGYGKQSPPTIPPAYKTPDYSYYDEINTYTLKVTRRDTDSNSHTNNISYLIWATDAIPEEIYAHNVIHEMKTSYKKECTCGMDIKIKTYYNKAENAMVIIITDAQEESNVLCEVFFVLIDHNKTVER